MDKGTLEQQYFSKLLEYFPIGKCKENFYYIIDVDEHYEGWDEDWGEGYIQQNKQCYKQSLKAIQNKTWDQVVLDDLQSDYDYTFGLPLTIAGELYYLPAFLHNYYNQVDELILINWKSYFIDDLLNGNLSSSDPNDKDNIPRKGYEFFEENLTREQSKMVAVFLVNEANLFDTPTAQQALTSYWGYFLLS